jgi:hypothetical protein
MHAHYGRQTAVMAHGIAHPGAGITNARLCRHAPWGAGEHTNQGAKQFSSHVGSFLFCRQNAFGVSYLRRKISRFVTIISQCLSTITDH